MNKKHKEKSALVEKESYPLDDAVKLLTQLSTTSFDGTAEVHARLGIDPKSGDQQVRTIVSLPHGTGKTIRVAALVPADMVKDAKAAGADRAGLEDLIADIEKGVIDFDVLVAVPSAMKQLGKLAKTLGQKGLMPNPKAGTVTDAPAKAIAELKKGRIELRADKQGIVHSIFGKMSFGSEKLADNLRVFITALRDAKPSGIKGEYIQSLVLSPTMGPSVRVELASL